MAKTELFQEETQKTALLCKALSHPARIAILQYLSKMNVCMSGDITEEIPLSRTTVSQHLKELKKAGLIQGTISGVKKNYCLNPDNIKKAGVILEQFFRDLSQKDSYCC
jgi:DNA-binding transcriptional ArsR family regulator